MLPVLPLLLGALAGLAWSALFWTARFLPASEMAGRTVRATATVETDAAAGYGEGLLRGTLRLSDIEGYRGELLVRCLSFPAGGAGDRFRAEFTLEALPDDEYRLSRYADGVYLAAEVTGTAAALPADGALRFRLYALRRALTQRLCRWLPEPYAGIESAMLLGDRSRFDGELYDAFRTAGVGHLLAVSGLHVALLCGVFLAGAKKRFSRPRILLRAALVLFYMALTGFSASVQRAGLVFLLALAGDFFLQPPDAVTSLGAAALMMSLPNAFAPCDVGFQLSFCTVLGVQAALALAERQKRFAENGKLPRLLAGALLHLWQQVQISLFAALAAMPVLIAHGMTVSGVAVLTNLLTVWMLRPALLLGLLVLALSALPVLAPAMHMASLLLGVWLRCLTALVQWCAALPMARLVLPRRYTLWVLAVLGLLFLVFRLRRRRVNMLWYLPAAAACTVLAVTLGIVLQRGVVTAALVGTAGNPCAVITQDGAAVVLFRGGASNLNAVEEYLTVRGIAAPDLVVDIRIDPQPLPELSAPVLTLAEQPEYSARPVGKETTLHLYHLASGNLAVLEAGGARVAVMAGNIRLPEPVHVDVLCAGGAYPDTVEADILLTNIEHPRWLEEAAGDTVYFGTGTPAVVIRPGRSLTLEEAKRLAVQ